jgi:Flp pilus assembly protein TadG
MKRFPGRVLDEEHGSALVEFALVIPVFAMVLLGTFQLMFMVYATSRLHWAVEQSARCAVISRSYSSAPAGDPTVGCQSKGSTTTYANSIYNGPRLTSLTFTPTEEPTCSGRQVAGSGTYSFRAGLVNLSVPITAKACFPTPIDPATPWT